MTKNIRLTKDYKLPNNIKIINNLVFFNYTRPSLENSEFYKPEEIPNDPDNVPIYDSTQCINIIKTIAIESYLLRHKDDIIEVPTAKADEFLAMKQDNKNIFEEVI